MRALRLGCPDDKILISRVRPPSKDRPSIFTKARERIYMRERERGDIGKKEKGIGEKERESERFCEPENRAESVRASERASLIGYRRLSSDAATERIPPMAGETGGKLLAKYRLPVAASSRAAQIVVVPYRDSLVRARVKFRCILRFSMPPR